MREPVRSQERRCAIYTRKSSEEGLEQGFNSLHAQREACEAYIKSQKHEGWRPLSTHYDDGGYSGGSLNFLRATIASNVGTDALQEASFLERFLEALETQRQQGNAVVITLERLVNGK